MKCRGINYSKKKINFSVLSNTALQVPLGLLKNIITVIKNEKSKKKTHPWRFHKYRRTGFPNVYDYHYQKTRPVRHYCPARR